MFGKTYQEKSRPYFHIIFSYEINTHVQGDGYSNE